ncbi:MAG TPA: hypothetical protein VNL36_08320 [Bacteroidota bacterium]|nr:hypothetical protein [Bacteroidota bacterium]
MESFYVNLGGFIVSTPTQRVLNFLLGVFFFMQAILHLRDSTSTILIVFHTLQSGFGGLLIGIALFAKSFDRPYYLFVSDKGLEGRIGFFKSVFIAWEEMRAMKIHALDIVITRRDNTSIAISLSGSPITELRAAKQQLTQWALQRGVLVHEN